MKVTLPVKNGKTSFKLNQSQTKASAPVKHRYGGRATAGGVGYEVQVAALLAVKMLVGEGCVALPGLSGGDIADITMQAPESVDDVILTLSGRPEASIFISAKHRANPIPLTANSPAFRYANHEARSAGGGAP